ncbi:GHMP kinase [Joostella atrarenae]|uniref:GHMP kinase n=1 Tax=Joostella atrarenae TaxID=679257 RepID=A0ABS9J4V1_9FLAO|nr:GYDIA family GHMP kinase [Joostella atrarenae]MCF8715448.1 GHMP kinase [Joostella atrarenae]
MPHKYHSNGKLLITGEYTVLDGAKSLALPTKFGQTLTVEETESKTILWKALRHNNEEWFTTEIDLLRLENKTEDAIINTTNNQITETLLNILTEAKLLNPSFLKGSKGVKVITKLEFPENWGLGSSSTLINNIASWANVNAFTLLWNSFSGSGYDIACAQNDSPIVYKLEHKNPQIETVKFDPAFKDQLFFIHLNKKQNSREGIDRYRKTTSLEDKAKAIKSIDIITEKIQNAQNLTLFENLLKEHEEVIASIIKLQPVKDYLFKDFKGEIKSLGAWGGDFILATGEKAYITNYFNEKGYHTILSYKEMIA